MPAAPRWQSSQRPLFVRTVWVNGIRHAILSADDPLLQYVPLTASRPSTTSSSPQSSSSIINSRRYRIEDCLVKLQLANTITTDNNYPHADEEDDEDEESIRMRNYIDEAVYRIRNHVDSYRQNCYDDSGGNDALRLPRLSRFIRPCSFYEHHKSEDTSDDTLLPELQENPLSERVMQWLDLSGKSKRLHTPTIRPGSEPSVQAEPVQKQLTTPTESRRPYSVCKKDIPIRSLSVDISRNLKITPKHNDSPKNRQPIETSSKARRNDNSEASTPKARSSSPIVHNYESPKLRPVTAWPQASPSPASVPNRPQLHIFMPPIDNDKSDNANTGHHHDEVSEYDSYTSDASK